MAGIYIHIPFCRQACRYCDFFFSVSLQFRDNYVERLIGEIEKRAGYQEWETMDTLYFGGGTPSVLLPEHLDQILDTVNSNFSFRTDPEMTIECNPDDLDPVYLDFLKYRGFNRISIGIQSFHGKDLKLMRRSHDEEQARRCVNDAASAGFENITIDLMYGIPGQSTNEWEKTIQQALLLPVSHLSAYHLTYEPGTVFDHWRKKNRIVPLHEEKSVELYAILRRSMLSGGFDHYEISNFARNGLLSEHNMIYWSGKNYLGFGPSAHSFDGDIRSWNVSSLKKYLEGIEKNNKIHEVEDLSTEEKYHDYLITSLRTKWGADPEIIRKEFGSEILDHFNLRSSSYLEKGSMWKTGRKLAIHPDQWLITDHILRELFVDSK